MTNEMQLIEVEFRLRKGYLGRFDFDMFIRQSGLNAMMNGDDEDKTKRQDLQRLYNELTKLWEEQNFIRFVGYKTVKGQRGRRFKIYEPNVNLTFKWHVHDIKKEENNES